jgi:hypothetical protein
LAEHVLPGGRYLLYTFISTLFSEPSGESAGPRLALSDIAAFAPWFALRSARHGEDRGRWSAWFLFQRTSVK